MLWIVFLTCQHSKRLEEIFVFLKTNLNSQATPDDTSMASLTGPMYALGLENESLSFQLFRENQTGSGEEFLLCPEATFESLPLSNMRTGPIAFGGVFKCLCSRHSHACSIYTCKLES